MSVCLVKGGREGWKKIMVVKGGWGDVKKVGEFRVGKKIVVWS